MGIEGRGRMSIKGNLSKIAELGIGIAAVATLALAGCGGSGSSGGSSSPTTVSGAAAANQFLADTTASWNADSVSSPTTGTPSVIAFAVTESFVATSSNSYTRGHSANKLATATSLLWSPAKSLSNLYYLSATGWQLDGATASYTVNGNGALSYTRMDGQSRGDISAITRTDLSGQPVACTHPMGNYRVGEQISTASGPTIVTAVSCLIAATYPAGSASYTSTNNRILAEQYTLIDNSYFHTLTDGAGVALSELPSVGVRFCLNASVYDPIPDAAAGTDNYHVYPFSYYESSGPCADVDIATALTNGSTETARVSLKATGNAVVPNVFVIRSKLESFTFDTIYAFHLGKLMSGSNSPAGTSTSTSTSFNKAAANAQLRANGLPPLP